MADGNLSVPELKRKQPKLADIETGHRIRQLRKEHAMSQEVLARKIGVTFQQIQKYERGANRISVSTLKLIAAAFGIPSSVLLGEDEPAGFTEHLPDLSVPGAVALLKLYARCSNEFRHSLLDLVRAHAADTKN